MNGQPVPNGTYLRISMAWKLIGALTGVFVLVIGWQALDLDRHEDLGAHTTAAIELAKAAESRNAMTERMAKLEDDLVKKLDQVSRDLRRVERAIYRFTPDVSGDPPRDATPRGG